MFFFMPVIPIINWVLLIYILAAVLPAFFLMRYIYKKDAVEKEPPELLANLALRGVGAALVSIVLEKLGNWLLDAFVSRNDPLYILLLAFLVVAAVEEGTKFFFLYRRTWRDWNFNYRFDGIIYAVFVSLGFAAFENISYVFSYGLSVALPRALLSIPGHMGFAVVMGLFYGRAKLRDNRGDSAGCRVNLVLAYLSAVFLHGFYDSCCMSGTSQSTVIFLLFVVVMYILVFRLIKHESEVDVPV